MNLDVQFVSGGKSEVEAMVNSNELRTRAPTHGTSSNIAKVCASLEVPRMLSYILEYLLEPWWTPCPKACLAHEHCQTNLEKSHVEHVKGQLSPNIRFSPCHTVG
jgi:hypothetical protein